MNGQSGKTAVRFVEVVHALEVAHVSVHCTGVKNARVIHRKMKLAMKTRVQVSKYL